MKALPRGLARSRALFVALSTALLSSPLRGQSQPRTLTLTQALELATGTSEAVAVARAGEQRARGQMAQARSALLPQVNSTMSWQKQLQNQFAEVAKRSSSNSNGNSNGSGGSSSGNTGSDTSSLSSFTRIFASQYNFNVGLSASQNLFTGGRVRAGIKAAQGAREVAEIGITAAQAQVQLDVTQAYYDAALSDRLVTIAESSLVQTERALRQVQLTRSVGSASEFELIRARVTRDNQRPAWLQARTQRDLAFVRLRQLLDLPTDQPLQLADDLSDAPSATPAPPPSADARITTVNVDPALVLVIDPRVQTEVASRLASTDTSSAARAGVRQARTGVDIAQQQLRSTKAQRLPSLAVQTNYQRLAYPANILPKSLADFFPNWTLGLGLSYPVFSGGRVRGEILAAEAGVVEARQRLKIATEAATLDARQATLQLTEAEASWQASVGTAEQAQRAYAIAEVRFKEGISTQLELSETRVQLQQALANRVRAARDYQVARKRLQLLPHLPLTPSAATAASTNTGPAR